MTSLNFDTKLVQRFVSRRPSRGWSDHSLFACHTSDSYHTEQKRRSSLVFASVTSQFFRWKLWHQHSGHSTSKRRHLNGGAISYVVSTLIWRWRYLCRLARGRHPVCTVSGIFVASVSLVTSWCDYSRQVSKHPFQSPQTDNTFSHPTTKQDFHAVDTGHHVWHLSCQTVLMFIQFLGYRQKSAFLVQDSLLKR